jgi:hypothetical protein
VAPLWTFMDATSTLTESDMYERDVLGAARVAAPAAEARCYRDNGRFDSPDLPPRRRFKRSKLLLRGRVRRR